MNISSRGEYWKNVLAFLPNIHKLTSLWRKQGRNDVGQGGTIPQAQNNCRGRQMSVGGAEKSQQFHKYFLQCSKFPSERPRVRTWGAKLVSCPGAIQPRYIPGRKGCAPAPKLHISVPSALFCWCKVLCQQLVVYIIESICVVFMQRLRDICRRWVLQSRGAKKN